MARLRRSRFYVSCGSLDAIAQARACGADVVVFDLEDLVPDPEDKPAARANLEAAFREVAAGAFDLAGAEAVVRVNHPATPFFEEDMRLLDSTLREAGKPDAVILPKTEAPEEVRGLERRLEEAEQKAGVTPGYVKVHASLESSKAILRAYDIAAASPRVVAISLGAGDLTKELAIRRTRGGEELMHARWHILLAARAAGVHAIDAAYWDKGDVEGWVQDARTAFRIGFDGKSLLRRDIIAAVHREYQDARAAARASDEAYWRQVEGG